MRATRTMTSILTPSKRILSPLTMTPSSSPRNLLLCFDAFGTLFKPRAPIEQQYGEVARSLGMVGVRDEDVKGRFREGR